MTLGKKPQKDKDKEMENIIEERKRISKKIVEFQDKYSTSKPVKGWSFIGKLHKF